MYLKQVKMFHFHIDISNFSCTIQKKYTNSHCLIFRENFYNYFKNN